MSERISALIDRLSQVLPNIGENSCRLIHGRGKTLPGLEQICVDWHAPLLIVSLFEAIEEPEIEQLCVYLTTLQKNPLIQSVVVHHRYRREDAWQWLFGSEHAGFFAHRNGLRFGLEVGRQQNVGFFLDMEPGRQWLEQISAGKRVLNLFSYTCAFSVVALAAGAEKVVNVDMSSRALSRGRDNHRLNGQDTSNVVFLAENILKSWGRIRKQGPFDVIIIDPPSFQKGSFVAERDYAKVIRRIPELAGETCEILACLNAPELTEAYLPGLITETLPELKLQGRLAIHPDFPEQNPNHGLKLFHYQYANTGKSES